VHLRSSLARTDKEAAAPRIAALVTAARTGSSSAFAELQTLFSRPLYNTIMRITKNKEDAEDALQDTFLRAFQFLPGFEGRSSFYSWLTRIGINSALMLLRKRRIRSEVSFGLPSDNADQPLQFEPEDSAADPEQICIQREQYIRTLHAIQMLHPSLRIPILLQATREYSLKEIARELKITEAAVKARLYRARARLGSRSAKNHRNYTVLKGHRRAGLIAT
jgi:RNA polymerase sigma-70 factor, ECF subfamily